MSPLATEQLLQLVAEEVHSKTINNVQNVGATATITIVFICFCFPL